MKTIELNDSFNLKVVRYEVDLSALYENEQRRVKKKKIINIPNNDTLKKRYEIPPPPVVKMSQKTQSVKSLVEQLLDELYAEQRCWRYSETQTSHGSTAASLSSSQSNCGEKSDAIERNYLEALDIEDLLSQLDEWKNNLQIAGGRLAKYLRFRDRLKREQRKLCAAFTIILHRITGDTNARFGVLPGNEGPGEGGFAEWLHAMRLVARLPSGIPQHFRRKLWLTLSERHLTSREIDWSAAERACFRGTAQRDDAELSAQILKDLHRTGCSLFCGTEGRENQAMLRRVLLAYARWNKEVGYCQGFNMLAAIILEVMEKSESDSLKVMIYLVEAVLPEGYFADDLRGLSADMAAFRDLLRLRIPRLAQHMDYLQKISDGGGVEPPLPDVFTMQWFLTLYATWLPRECLLRIWDLILLDGNEILLLTALAIWDMLQDRILSARSADEFYSCMGGGASAVWEAGDSLVARVVAFNSAPELPRLRSLHRYRVTPPAPPNAPPAHHPPLQSAMQSMTKKGLRLFYSEDEGESSDDSNKMALATIIPRRDDRSGTGDRLSLDIGALKRQYARLRERQRQAHVILAAACARHAAVGVPTSPTSLTVNNLLLGKSAIVSSRGRRLGPPPGAVPPSRNNSINHEKPSSYSSGTSSETITWKEAKTRRSLDRRNSLKWKDVKMDKGLEKTRKASIDLDETGDGIIVSELEANEMIASLRSRSSSESSSYSNHTGSSTDTSLCDDNHAGSESEADIVDDDKPNEKKISMRTSSDTVTSRKDKKSSSSKNKETVVPSSPKPEKKSHKENTSHYFELSNQASLRSNIDKLDLKLSDTFEKFKQDQQTINTVTQIVPIIESSIESLSTKCLPTNFGALSPVDLSPYHHLNLQKSSFCYDFEANLRRPSLSKETSSRPPDLIDSFTMYPNFVPDIDISEKYSSDIESPLRSPESDSITVSEDERPIPLKIDKYFEHSPEFFGARLTDPNNDNIPSRRSTKRNSRIPKKTDSLTANCTNSDNSKSEVERASSLPQTHEFVCKKSENSDKNDIKTNEIDDNSTLQIEVIENIETNESSIFDIQIMQLPTIDDVFIVPTKANKSPEQHNILQSGRKNSERALQIIQENSQILNRILTKQNLTKNNVPKSPVNTTVDEVNKQENVNKSDSMIEKPFESPILKESTSDSLIGGIRRKPRNDLSEKNKFTRARPISIDDPFSFESRAKLLASDGIVNRLKSPSSECLTNKTDLYGWENKGFLAKCVHKNPLPEDEEKQETLSLRKNSEGSVQNFSSSNDLKPISETITYSFSGESKTSITHPSSEIVDNSINEQRFMSDEFNYPLSSSSKYDYILTKSSDICSNTLEKDPKLCDNFVTDSQLSDFSQKVTSSISFTYEPSVDDDSPSGAKSNSSDTLCQIASLDQVSTPISPKTFPNRESLSYPKEFAEKSDKLRLESDDTISAITSLLEKDTLSSLSYPRSPSSSSYHPFPTRPVMRTPKDIGVRLGLYPKETVSSPPK